MWANTIVLTFLFFVILLGVGLAILAVAPIKLIEACRLTRVQFIVMGFAIGASATGIFVELLSLFVPGLWSQSAILLAIALSGYVLTWPIWRLRPGDGRGIALWAALSFAIALMTWWWSFGAFSHFPFGDIGADVHWMKAAQAYANSGIVNPYATQSYIDLRSAVAGALSGMLGLDLLQFSWTYRYFSILFFLLTFYAFAEGVFADPLRRWLAFLFAGMGNTLALLTNGSLALAGSLVFLGVLLQNTDRESKDLRLGSVLLPIAGAAAALLLVFALNNNTLVLTLLIAGLLVLRLMGSKSEHAAITFSWIWPATLLLAHRGSFLFVPTVIVAWLCYLAISHLVSRRESRSSKLLYVLAFALPAASALITACVIAMRFQYIPSITGNWLFSRITSLIVGKEIRMGEELSLGAGPDVAVIELGRAMGPLFSLCIVLAIAWWWMIRPALQPAGAAVPRPDTSNNARLIWSWIAGCGLGLAVLSGFPFLYRTSFIILSLFTITATELFCQLLMDPLQELSRRRRIAAVTVTSVAAALVLGLYAFAWRENFSSAGYQAMLRPAEVAGIGLMLALLALTFVRSPWVQICCVAGAVGLGVAIDRAGIATVAKVYSYGRLPQHAEVVSHYDASDLEMARWLRSQLRNFVVLSDPYTTGLVQSLTGAPGVYVFSNLDTVNVANAEQAKAVISQLGKSGEKNSRFAKACTALAPLLHNLSQETSFQIRKTDFLTGVLKPVRPPPANDAAGQPSSALLPAVENDPAAVRLAYSDLIQRVLGGKEGAWNVIAVINPRTAQWIQQGSSERLSYFPPEGPLDADVRTAVRGGAFKVIFSNEQNIVVLVQCT